MNKTALPQAEHWNHYWGLDQEQFKKISWSKRRIIETLQPFIKSGNNALDAGCGSGFFSGYFISQGMNTTSLDYSTQALEITRQMTQSKANIIQKDLLNDPLSQYVDQRFDLIFTDGLFEHFTEPQQDKIFNNLCSVLSDRGVLATFVPNKWSPWELIRPFYMPGIEEDPFTLSQLVRLNERNGLTVLCKG